MMTYNDSMAPMVTVVRDFHGVLSKYTDFVLKDIAQKYNLDYKELVDKYIVPASRQAKSIAKKA
jgi:hypothetical protein